MTQQFTASEVRAEAHRHANEVEDMLNAFADMLEAREKAVPVYQHRSKNGPLRPWFDCSEEIFMAMEHNEHDREHFDRRILYTHPVPSDSERLADETALRHGWAYSYSGSNLYGDDGELQDNAAFPHIDWLRDSVQELHQKVAKRGAAKLATHSAQAQPPAGQFDPGRDEAIRIHPDVAKAQAIPFDVNDGRPTRSAQAQPPANQDKPVYAISRSMHSYYTQDEEEARQAEFDGASVQRIPAQPPVASVTVDAVMRVIDGQRRLPYCSIDEKQAFRNELEAALASQENPNG